MEGNCTAVLCDEYAVRDVTPEAHTQGAFPRVWEENSLAKHFEHHTRVGKDEAVHILLRGDDSRTTARKFVYSMAIADRNKL